MELNPTQRLLTSRLLHGVTHTNEESHDAEVIINLAYMKISAGVIQHRGYPPTYQ